MSSFQAKKLKQQVNSLLTRTTGYRLSRTDGYQPLNPAQGPVPSDRSEKLIRRVAKEAAEAAVKKLRVADTAAPTRGAVDQAAAPPKTAAPEPKPAAPASKRSRSQPAGWDIDSFQQEAMQAVSSRTMTSHYKMLGLIDAVRHVSKHQIEGDIVECGVWRGGSMMLAALTLLDQGDTSRDLYLYDTYEGMAEAGEFDVRQRDGASATSLMEKSPKSSGVWAYASLEDVQQGMESSGYPREKMHFVKGKVEDTIPETAPEKISVLRLDTDWYSSTAHELEHLYPRLAPGGVIIFDDYGYWEGARKAVDDFLAETGEALLLVRVAEGRLAIKPRS